MTPRADLNDDRLTLMGLLVEVMSGVESAVGAQLAEHGLTPVEFGVLVRLSRSPHQRLRMSDLTAQTSLTNSGITRVVDRLSHTGCARREACPMDRRSTYTVLTAAGLEKVQASLPGHLDVVDRWLVSPLTPGQRAGLVSALRTVRNEVRPEAVAGAEGPGAEGPGAEGSGAEGSGAEGSGGDAPGDGAGLRQALSPALSSARL